jgi:hypothetical protein
MLAKKSLAPSIAVTTPFTTTVPKDFNQQADYIS